ncbi:MAG: hypothetical protein ACRBN8_44105 [Nannocystales bacterium]
MSEDVEHDSVEEALLEMGLFDAQDAAIERAEAEGFEASVPDFSSEKMDAIVAASLRASEPQADEAPSPSPRVPRWIPWACGVAVALAAAIVLWQAPPDAEAPSIGAFSVPTGQLKLGGTARILGDTPAVRTYGPGDAFFVELSFDAPLDSGLVAEVFAQDSSGALRPVPLATQRRDGSVVFDGEIAELLSPGVWTLQVRYGGPSGCPDSTSVGCKTAETRIRVVGP